MFCDIRGTCSGVWGAGFAVVGVYAGVSAKMGGEDECF